MTDKNIRIFNEIRGITEKADLARAIADELAGYSIYDLMKISAWHDREIGALPSPYREKLRPYMAEQIFGRFTQIMAMRSNGDLQGLSGQINDLPLYRDFCDTENRHLRARLADNSEDDQIYGSFDGLYYLLINCFYMFVLDEPGHPRGTPFPGGFTVRLQGDTHYCPIRDKEKDVWYSICNFCPAKQDEANQ